MDINKTVIPCPYCDWKGLRELGSYLPFDDALGYRYRASMGLSTEVDRYPDYDNRAKPIEIVPLTNTKYLTLFEIKQLITIALVKKVKEDGIKGVDIENETGFNRTLLSKLITSVKKSDDLYEAVLEDGTKRLVLSDKKVLRPFSATLLTAAPLANMVMKSTVHHMYFGEEGKIRLTHKYSMYAEGLSDLDKAIKENLISTGRELMDECIADYRKELENMESGKRTDLSPYGQIKNIGELLYERITELSDENEYMYGSKFTFNRTVGGYENFKETIRDITNEKNRDAGNDAYEPYNEFIMFLALESGQAMDYFIRNDYLGYASEKGQLQKALLITDENGNEITDSDVLNILSYATSLKGDSRVKYNALVMSTLIKSGCWKY